VPEYDAFGREIGEDPLAALRDATVEAKPAEAAEDEAPRTEARVAPPAAEPPAAEPRLAPPPAAALTSVPPAAEPRFAPPAPPRPRFVRPRVRRRGSVAGLLVVVAIFGAIGLGGSVLVDRVENFTGSLPGLGQPEPAPTGLQPRSLIRRANLAAALEVLRESGDGRPVALRVAADRVDATLAGPAGIRQVQVTPDYHLRTIATAEPAALPPTTPYGRIDPAAPERLVRSARAPAGRVDYVLLVTGRPLTWRAYFRDGTNVAGDARGRS
jgi:hypothetical protein